MHMTFRWFGPTDPIPLGHIRRFPGVHGDRQRALRRPVGEAWPRQVLERLAEQRRRGRARARGHREHSRPRGHQARSPDARPARRPVLREHPRHGRRRHPGALLQLHADLRLDAHRLAMPHARRIDGARVRRRAPRAHRPLARHRRPARLGGRLRRRRRCRRCSPPIATVDAERLWENLAYFLERVVPVAASADVKLAIHPDDPPWPIFGLPRIITNARGARSTDATRRRSRERRDVLHRLTRRRSSERSSRRWLARSASADAFISCTAATCVAPGRVAFTRVRIRRRSVTSTCLRSCARCTILDLRGPMRPDHGRMIWDEHGRPGYGLYDRALGATYCRASGKELPGHQVGRID